MSKEQELEKQMKKPSAKPYVNLAKVDDTEAKKAEERFRKTDEQLDQEAAMENANPKFGIDEEINQLKQVESDLAKSPKRRATDEILEQLTAGLLSKQELDQLLESGRISENEYNVGLQASKASETGDITPEHQDRMITKDETPDGTVSGMTGDEAEEVAEEVINDPTVPTRYKKSMYSIWDAYYGGEIDEGTAVKFTLDSIATLAKNLGRDQRNVAAAYTGGAIDTGHDESMWEKRRDRMFGEEVESEAEQTLNGPSSRKAESENLSIQSQSIANRISSITADNEQERQKQQLALVDTMLQNEQDKRALIDYYKEANPDWKSDKVMSELIWKLSNGNYLTEADMMNFKLGVINAVGGAVSSLVPGR